jgi:Raf kinase inhibitor-like YbhB/YbcL family protein
MTSTRLKTIAAMAAAAAFGAVVSVQAQPAGGAQSGPPVLAKTLAPSKGGAPRLLITSNVLRSGGEMDDRFTQNGDNKSPPINWSRGPAGTQSYVILAEDAGVDRAEPIVHWVIYDLPSASRGVPLGLAPDATLENGAKQGKNVRGAAGYVGPKPPAGQTHPYHFQVFALNARLNIDPAEADRKTVVEAMKGHVLSLGDFVVNYTGK